MKWFEAFETKTQTRAPEGVSPYRTNYVAAGDGQRFLVNTQSGDGSPAPITVVMNWTSRLKRPE